MLVGAYLSQLLSTRLDAGLILYSCCPMQQLPHFDSTIDRRSLPGEKWGRYAGRDVLPLWVADMDFAAPDAIIAALQQRIAHPVFGYTDAWPSLIDAVIEGIERDYEWTIEPDWLVWLPGVVSGFNLACLAGSAPGDEVLTHTPVYPPFLAAPGNTGRTLVSSAMTDAAGRWQWDRTATEAAIGPRTRLLLLCSPHNPTGRVFDDDELSWLAQLAERHDLTVCSDEIHCGLVLDEIRRHRPIASLGKSIAARTITLMAPSKTWNIPALYCAFAIIPDAGLRLRYRQAMRGLIPQPNLLGMVAAEAAYRHGDPWRQMLLAYLRSNRATVQAAVEAMPGVKSLPPESTYLAWLDCRALPTDDPAAFFEHAGVGLSDGRPFGMPGFVRLNFGCPRSTLDEALTRMTRAVENLT